MPRDVMPIEPPARPDLSTPSLEGIAYILRHRELWPAGFQWQWASVYNPDDCWNRIVCGCGLGLALKRWTPNMLRLVMQLGGSKEMYLSAGGKLFGLRSPTIIESLFFTSERDAEDTMPEHVADRIDRFLHHEDVHRMLLTPPLYGRTVHRQLTFV